MFGPERRENLSRDPQFNPFGFIDMGAIPIVSTDPENGVTTTWSTSDSLGRTQRVDITGSKRLERRLSKQVVSVFEPYNLIPLQGQSYYHKLFIGDYGTDTAPSKSLVIELEVSRKIDGTYVTRDAAIALSVQRGRHRAEVAYNPAHDEDNLNPIESLSLYTWAEDDVEVGDHKLEPNSAVFYLMNRSAFETGSANKDADILANLVQVKDLVQLASDKVLYKNGLDNDFAIQIAEGYVEGELGISEAEAATYVADVISFVQGYYGDHAEGELDPTVLRDISIASGTTILMNISRDIPNLSSEKGRERLEEEAYEWLAWTIVDFYLHTALATSIVATFRDLSSGCYKSQNY